MPRPPKPSYYDRVAAAPDGDEPALLVGHRFDGHPCRACDVPLRAGDPIEFVADGITHSYSRGRDYDWQALMVVHAACVGPDDVTMMPVPVALPPRPERSRPTP